jgi:hypothetical protein
VPFFHHKVLFLVGHQSKKHLVNLFQPQFGIRVVLRQQRVGRGQIVVQLVLQQSQALHKRSAKLSIAFPIAQVIFRQGFKLLGDTSKYFYGSRRNFFVHYFFNEIAVFKVQKVHFFPNSLKPFI